jgi:hypothetical protein
MLTSDLKNLKKSDNNKNAQDETNKILEEAVESLSDLLLFGVESKVEAKNNKFSQYSSLVFDLAQAFHDNGGELDKQQSKEIRFVIASENDDGDDDDDVDDDDDDDDDGEAPSASSKPTSATMHLIPAQKESFVMQARYQ